MEEWTVVTPTISKKQELLNVNHLVSPSSSRTPQKFIILSVKDFIHSEHEL